MSINILCKLMTLWMIYTLGHTLYLDAALGWTLLFLYLSVVTGAYSIWTSRMLVEVELPNTPYFHSHCGFTTIMSMLIATIVFIGVHYV